MSKFLKLPSQNQWIPTDVVCSGSQIAPEHISVQQHGTWEKMRNSPRLQTSPNHTAFQQQWRVPWSIGRMRMEELYIYSSFHMFRLLFMILAGCCSRKQTWRRLDIGKAKLAGSSSVPLARLDRKACCCQYIFWNGFQFGSVEMSFSIGSSEEVHTHSRKIFGAGLVWRLGIAYEAPVVTHSLPPRWCCMLSGVKDAGPPGTRTGWNIERFWCWKCWSLRATKDWNASKESVHCVYNAAIALSELSGPALTKQLVTYSKVWISSLCKSTLHHLGNPTAPSSPQTWKSCASKSVCVCVRCCTISTYYSALQALYPALLVLHIVQLSLPPISSKIQATTLLICKDSLWLGYGLFFLKLLLADHTTRFAPFF